MADTISRAAALDVLDHERKVLIEQERFGAGHVVVHHARRLIEELPAVGAIPVVHGRWICYPECLGYDGAYSDGHIVCSNCKSAWSIIDNDTERFDFCPACGAKMAGERGESE